MNITTTLIQNWMNDSESSYYDTTHYRFVFSKGPLGGYAFVVLELRNLWYSSDPQRLGPS